MDFGRVALVHLDCASGYLNDRATKRDGHPDVIELVERAPKEPWLFEPRGDGLVSLKSVDGYLGSETDGLSLRPRCGGSETWRVRREGDRACTLAIDGRFLGASPRPSGSRRFAAMVGAEAALRWTPRALPLVAAELRGALGNQLFIAAATLAAAWDAGGAAVFSGAHARPDRHDTFWDSVFSNLRTVDYDVWRKQDWSMTHFALEPLSAVRKGELVASALASRLLRGSANQALLDWFRRPGVRAFLSQYEYREVPRPREGESLRLSGFYQNARYFSSHRERLRGSFVCPSEDAGFVNHRLEEQRRLHPGRPLVGLHVRRGDFLSWGSSLGFSVVLTWENYYRAAVARFPEEAVFLIFSDDLPWCEEHFSTRLPRFELMRGGTNVQDLFTLAGCDHMIIANSSFSYWSAVLSGSGSAIVAPSRWRDVTHELDRFSEDIATAASRVSEKICLGDWIRV